MTPQGWGKYLFFLCNQDYLGISLEVGKGNLVNLCPIRELGVQRVEFESLQTEWGSRLLNDNPVGYGIQ